MNRNSCEKEKILILKSLERYNDGDFYLLNETFASTDYCRLYAIMIVPSTRNRVYILAFTSRGAVKMVLSRWTSQRRKRYCSLRYFWSTYGCTACSLGVQTSPQLYNRESVIYRLHRTHERACKMARDTFDTTGWPWRRRHRTTGLCSAFLITGYHELRVSLCEKQIRTYYYVRLKRFSRTL